MHKQKPLTSAHCREIPHC